MTSDDPQPTPSGLETPVVLSVFARPRCVRRLVAALRTARPRLLLVFADAPRAERPAEADQCRQAREVLEDVDWPCDVRWNVSDVNLGPRERIQSGLRWAFEQVEEAIFFEEDCIPHPTFLPFCHELLARYRDDSRVLLISGMRGEAPAPPGGESYGFSTNWNLYGWAAWRRSWELYEDNVDSWPGLRSTRWLRRFVDSRREARVWEKRFDLVRRGLDTWDYSLVFSFWKARGLSIRPRHDLVENVGFGPHGTNTLNADSEVARRRARPMELPLVHPEKVPSWRATRRRERGSRRKGTAGHGPDRTRLDRIAERAARLLGPTDRSGRLRRLLRYRSTDALDHLETAGTSLSLADPTIASCLPYGWSFGERDGRWTIGTRAVLVWRTGDEVPRHLTCSIDASPALCPSHPGLRVDVFVNGEPCAGRSYGSVSAEPVPTKSVESIDRFRIPETLLRERERMVMTLLIRWPMVPAEHDLSDDFRPLGLFVRRIQFT